MKYKGILFDLDGVIVSTDDYHYKAWKQLADRENIYFDRKINERLRGVSRMESLDIMLEKANKEYTSEEKEKMATDKNEVYKKLILSLTPSDLLSGVKEFLESCKENNIKIGIGSSSKNTKIILEKIGYNDYFDCIVDGNDIKKSKPDPEVFIKGYKALNLEPKDCLVVEDAVAGVEAGLKAGCDVLAVGYASESGLATYHKESLNNVELCDLK